MQGAFDTVEEAIEYHKLKLDILVRDIVMSVNKNKQYNFEIEYNEEYEYQINRIFVHILDLETLKTVWENGKFVATD